MIRKIALRGARILQASGLIVCFCLLAIALLFYSLDPYLQLQKTKREYQQLSSEVSQLKAKNQELIREIEQLKNDAETIERIAREVLSLAGPNEIILRLPGRGKTRRQN